MPSISIISPNYNGERWLGNCLDSVASQTLAQEEIEMILVDDGSLDKSTDIAKEYKSHIPGLKLVQAEHTGRPGELRNRALDMAIGRYVLFLDSDDYLGEESLGRLSEFASENEPDVLAFQLEGLDRNVPKSMLQETIENADLVESGLYKTLGTWKMCRTEYLNDNSIRFSNLPRGEDTLFFAEAMLRAKRLSILSGYPFYTVRGREDGSSITQKEWNNEARISLASRMAALTISLASSENIANHFLIRVFNTDAVGVLKSSNARTQDLTNLRSSLKPYWSDDVKKLIYTDENRDILTNFLEGSRNG